MAGEHCFYTSTHSFVCSLECVRTDRSILVYTHTVVDLCVHTAVCVCTLQQTGVHGRTSGKGLTLLLRNPSPSSKLFY